VRALRSHGTLVAVVCVGHTRAMGTSFTDNYRFLARYNRWFNVRLYAACAGLTSEQLESDRGAFFRSIRGTLDHLAWTDVLWLGRFALAGETFPSLPTELLGALPSVLQENVRTRTFESLTAFRDTIDAAIENWFAHMPDDAPQRTIRYGNMKGVQREHAMWQAMTHLFNHQTHHRGQITTMLTQLGIDVGVTDLISLV